MLPNKAFKKLLGLLSDIPEKDVEQLVIKEAEWRNAASVAGTTAIAESPFYRAKRPGRVVSVVLVPGAAVTANGTNYWTILIDKRPASAPATPVNILTFAADTPATDDLVAFDEKDLTSLLSSTLADLELAEGDVLTAEVTKTGGTGLAFPIAQLSVEVKEESDD